MSQIEQVARAINDATCDDLSIPRDDDWEAYIPEAKAAIAAMTVQAEPDAWLYTDRMSGLRFSDVHRRDFPGCTEATLYAHPPVPQEPVEQRCPSCGVTFAQIGNVDDYLARAHAQIASGQSRENTELDAPLYTGPTPPAGGSDAE